MARTLEMLRLRTRIRVKDSEHSDFVVFRDFCRLNVFAFDVSAKNSILAIR